MLLFLVSVSTRCQSIRGAIRQGSLRIREIKTGNAREPLIAGGYNRDDQDALVDLLATGRQRSVDWFSPPILRNEAGSYWAPAPEAMRSWIRERVTPQSSCISRSGLHVPGDLKKFGRRFSRKAATPSSKSEEAKALLRISNAIGAADTGSMPIVFRTNSRPARIAC
jgi:hypothetical protein